MLLHSVLTPEQVKIPLQAGERDAAIRELLEMVAGKVNDKETVYSAVLEREKVMSTGVGNAIAIPHCKSSACPQFVIALGITPEGIDFRAVDGIKVNLVFLLLGPEDAPNMHIKLLSRISRIMIRPQVRADLLQSSTAAQAWHRIETAEKELQEA